MNSIQTDYVLSSHGVSKRAFNIRVCIIIGSVLLVTHFHYSTTTQYVLFHDVYRRLYYLPIILGGIWFRTRGGIVTAILVSLIYAPHVFFQWGNQGAEQLDQFLEVFLYNVVGILTGLLSEKEWHQRQQLAKIAYDLEHSYSRLKEQAETILEVEDQLVKASHLSALGELSASLAHEIRNPLSSIRGTAEILSDPNQTTENRTTFSNILIKETKRLNEVLENFLRFSVTSPDGSGWFDLHETLDELLVLTRPECERLNLAVKLDKGDLLTIPGDKSQLKQVFLNFVLNAAQAMESGGILEIKSSREGTNAVIEFNDNGPGIPDTDVGKIFDPFFTTKDDGVGLGLAITNRIIKAHGGRIDIYTSVEEGTNFKIFLPLVVSNKDSACI